MYLLQKLHTAAAAAAAGSGLHKHMFLVGGVWKRGEGAEHPVSSPSLPPLPLLIGGKEGGGGGIPSFLPSFPPLPPFLDLPSPPLPRYFACLLLLFPSVSCQDFFSVSSSEWEDQAWSYMEPRGEGGGEGGRGEEGKRIPPPWRRDFSQIFSFVCLRLPVIVNRHILVL